MMDQYGKPKRNYTSLEFSHLYLPQDFKALFEAIRQVVEEKVQTITLDLKGRNSEDETEEIDFTTTLSVLRRNHEQKTSVLLVNSIKGEGIDVALSGHFQYGHDRHGVLQ